MTTEAEMDLNEVSMLSHDKFLSRIIAVAVIGFIVVNIILGVVLVNVISTGHATKATAVATQNLVTEYHLQTIKQVEDSKNAPAEIKGIENAVLCPMLQAINAYHPVPLRVELVKMYCPKGTP